MSVRTRLDVTGSMRILVTGGAGFIGSHVADAYLAEGHDVAVFDDLSSGKRGQVPAQAVLFEGDLRDADALERAVAAFRPDVINHHAAQIDVRRSVAAPAEDAAVNVVGTLHLLEAARRHGVRRVVFASTGGAIYGEPAPADLPAREDTPPEPLSPYGAAKLAAEQYLGMYRRLWDVEPVILRYGNVYGPRQDPHGEAGVVAIFSGLALRGEPLRVYGDGEQTRDYVYVGDVVRANLLALTGRPGVYNVGTGVETSVNQLVAAFEQVLGRRLPVKREPPRPGEVGRIALDARRAREVLGWEPRVNLAEGVARTLAWFRDGAGGEAAKP